MQIHMTETLIFVASITALVIAIMVTLYGIVGNAPPKPERQAYRQHRPWNFK